MRWLDKLFCPSKISKFGFLLHHTIGKHPSGPCNAMKIVSNICLDKVPQTGWLCAAHLQHFGSGSVNIHIPANPLSLDGVSKLQCNVANLHNFFQVPAILCRRFGNPVWKENPMSRDWLAQLWLEEKREKNVRRRRRKQGSARHIQYGNTAFDTSSSFQLPFMKSSLSRSIPTEQGVQVGRTIEQPPISQYDVGFLSPKSPEEVKLAPLLARANLLITRDIEWANIMFAFEQESRFAIVDACYPQSPVGFIREQSNIIYRQILRTRRPFVAYITDAMGNEIFRVRRPFWLINSTIYAEVDGKEVGVVHRRWHLWRRIYDLYLGNKQFAVVENPGFWNWTFTLKDEDDRVLAQIDRDWRGLGFELFTDAGQYVIRFGDTDSTPKSGLASEVEKLEVARPLTLSERAVAIALAVSLDCDYFSRRGGWGLPVLVVGE